MWADSSYFTLLHQIGQVAPHGNVEVEINKTTGITTNFTSTGTLAVAAVGSTATLDLEGDLGLSAGIARPGVAVILRGLITATDSSALIRITSGTAGAWVCETLRGDNGTYAIGTVGLLTDVAEYGGSAPDAEDMKPTMDTNIMQMYDMAFGKNDVAASQDTKFDNSLSYLGQEIQNRMGMYINRDLIFSTASRSPQSGKDYGSMKGLAGFMGLSNTSAVTNGVNGVVDTGTAVDFWQFIDWTTKFTMGSTHKTFLTSFAFSAKIAKAAESAGVTVRTSTIQFPRIAIQTRTIAVGDFTLNLVADRQLSYASPIFSDGTNTAAHQNMGFALDLNNFKLMYHDNKELGLMTMKVRDIEQLRNKRVKEKELIAALTCGMWKLPTHGAYGLTNS